MPVALTHDRKTGAVNVTLSFTADAQVEKPGLERGVIENHLLTQAANECARAAAAALTPPDAAAIDAEAAAEKAKIDADAAKKKASALTSNVTANPKVK